MIKTLSTTSPSLLISAAAPTYVYGSGQSAGNIRYNTNTQNYEVYDGNMWMSVSQSATVGLSYEAEEAIRWAKDKMAYEATLKERMDKHPGLKDAWDKFQVMDILTREENTK